MNFVSAKPSLPLSPYVKFYWMLETAKPSSEEFVHRIIPNGLLELSFYLGSKPDPVQKDRVYISQSLISGQLKRFYDIKYSDSLTVFSIYFYPHGLSMFFDLPISELLNQTIPLRYLIKDRCERLEDELFGAITFRKRVSVIEQFLLEQLKKNSVKYNYKRINHCVDIITRHRGVIDIVKLSAEACLSRKQFERIFSDHIGMSPKQFLKVVRFQNVINQRSKDPSVSLTKLAYHCGYFYQSHMVRDFRDLSGLSPKEYFNQCAPFSDYFQE